MAEGLDVNAGWCCDGRTWTEHAHEGGECCQPKGTKIEDLPPEAQQAAKAELFIPPNFAGSPYASINQAAQAPSLRRSRSISSSTRSGSS